MKRQAHFAFLPLTWLTWASLTVRHDQWLSNSCVLQVRGKRGREWMPKTSLEIIQTSTTSFRIYFSMKWVLWLNASSGKDDWGVTFRRIKVIRPSRTLKSRNNCPQLSYRRTVKIYHCYLLEMDKKRFGHFSTLFCYRFAKTLCWSNTAPCCSTLSRSSIPQERTSVPFKESIWSIVKMFPLFQPYSLDPRKVLLHYALFKEVWT